MKSSNVLQLLTIFISVITTIFVIIGNKEITYLSGELNKNNEVESRKYNEKLKVYSSLIDIIEETSPYYSNGINGYIKIGEIFDKVDSINTKLAIYGSDKVNDLLICTIYSSYIPKESTYLSDIETGNNYAKYYEQNISNYIDKLILQIKKELNETYAIHTKTKTDIVNQKLKFRNYKEAITLNKNQSIILKNKISGKKITIYRWYDGSVSSKLEYCKNTFNIE